MKFNISTYKNFFTTLSSIFFLVLIFTSCNSDPSKKVKEENLKAVQEKALQKSESSEITFDFDNYNYGEVVDGDVVEVDFNFTNTGNSDLIIFDASASCGCTVPDYPKNKNIKPGEGGNIKVMFDTSNKPGKQVKSVTLSTNTNSGKKIIRINGFVLNK
ncbi:MAG: DUF1573 domain-containing protein [Flavobacteriaceae bacterium]|nr:DUF1573 domain-containing protein [Flavobacteriaceae bacterium]MBL6684077.1 DUF1573 domain-containing protein [Flavobacteriaceae bacterium]